MTASGFSKALTTPLYSLKVTWYRFLIFNFGQIKNLEIWNIPKIQIEICKLRKKILSPKFLIPKNFIVRHSEIKNRHRFCNCAIWFFSFDKTTRPKDISSFFLIRCFKINREKPFLTSWDGSDQADVNFTIIV